MQPLGCLFDLFAYVGPLARVAQLATFECVVALVGVDEADPLDGVVGMRVIVDGLDDYDSAVRSLRSDTLKRHLTKLIGPEREPADAPQSIKADREGADAILELARSKARYGQLEGIPARMVAGALGVDRVTLHPGLLRLFGRQ